MRRCLGTPHVGSNSSLSDVCFLSPSAPSIRGTGFTILSCFGGTVSPGVNPCSFARRLARSLRSGFNRCPPTTTCRHRSACCGLLAFYSSLPRSSPYFIAAALTIDKPWVRGKRPHKSKRAAVPSSVGRAGGRSAVLGRRVTVRERLTSVSSARL